MVRREPESGLLQTCAAPGAHPGHEAELGVLAYETLCRGLLSGRFRSIPTFPKSDLRARDDRFKGGICLRILALVRKLEKVAERGGRAPHEARATLRPPREVSNKIAWGATKQRLPLRWKGGRELFGTLPETDLQARAATQRNSD